MINRIREDKVLRVFAGIIVICVILGFYALSELWQVAQREFVMLVVTSVFGAISLREFMKRWRTKTPVSNQQERRQTRTGEDF